MPVPEMPSDRRLNLQYIILQTGFWLACAAICAYQAALLLDRGFTNTQVGVVVAVRCLAGAIAMPLMGVWADKHPHIPLKRLMLVCLGISLAASLVLLRPMGMAGTCCVVFVIGALEVAVYPLVDAMAIQYIHAGAKLSYSLGRGVGSLAYAVSCALLGVQAAQLGVETTLWTHVFLLVLLMALTAVFPTFDRRWLPPEDPEKAKPRSAWAVLGQERRFTLTLVGVFLAFAGVMPLSFFLVNILSARGGGEVHLGVAYFLMAAFELPSAFLFNKLYRRGRAGIILGISMLFMGLKAVLCLIAGSYWAVWLVQPVQMLGFGLCTPATVFCVSDTMPEADQVKGQSLMMVASNGLGGLTGSFLGGAVLDAWGADAMLWMCLGICLAAAAVTLLAAAGGRRKDQKGITDQVLTTDRSA